MSSDPDPRNGLTAEEAAVLTLRRAAAREWARQIDSQTMLNEDARVLAAAEADPDALPLTEGELNRLRPAIEVDPEVVVRHIRRTREPRPLVPTIAGK